MSDRAIVDFLAGVPLLQGHDLVQLAQVVRRRTVREGEMLFRQGEAARELLLVVDGALSISLHQPGDRTVGVARVGAGQMLGEIALLDGRGHTMSVRVTEAGAVLALGRLDFMALLAGQDPTAFKLRRRLAALFAARLRNQLQHLAGSLGGEAAGAAGPPHADLEPCRPPDSKYVSRMASFHEFDPLALWG